MNPVYGIALSGLNAASTRLANSANNVANAGSTSRLVNGSRVDGPYLPTDVVQTSVPNGGVQTSLQTRDPATTQVYAPDSAEADANGVVTLPNVDLAQEIAGQQIPATYDYKANLKVIKAQDDMFDSLLNIKS